MLTKMNTCSPRAIGRYLIQKNNIFNFKKNFTNFPKGKQYSTNTEIDYKKDDQNAYKTTLEECMPSFYNLVAELTAKKDGEPEELSQRLYDILHYNAPKGKRVRILALVTLYKILESPEKLTVENLELAYILGWCIEMLNASILINDDIMDEATMRRGLPSWYLVDNKGVRAMSDARTLEYALFEVLKNHFSNHPCYRTIMEVFHNISFMTCLGQGLDNILHTDKTLSTADIFSAEKYTTLLKYKTSYITCEIPVLLALHLSRRYDENIYAQMKDLFMELGYFYQVENDFSDCYGDLELTGKAGNDIEEGKCTWFMVTAMQKATSSQRKFLEENYGSTNPKKVQNVLKLYDELGVLNMCNDYKKNIDRRAASHYKKLLNIFPEIFFTSMTDIICKTPFRTKKTN